MSTFPYLHIQINFLNTRYAFSIHCSLHKILRNLAAADELPDKFVFRIQICSSHSRAQNGLWAAVKIVLNGVSRLRMVRIRSSDSCTGWMRRWFEKNCCLSPVGSVRLTGSSFLSDLNLGCKLHHLILDKWFTLETKRTCSDCCVFRLSGILRRQYLGMSAFMFNNFAGIPAKSAPRTRTDFNYFFEDLTDADAPT